jgi:4-hydroxy-tetrahydrodipicolinate synthase
MTLLDRWRGSVIPAVPVPFNAAGEIDWELHDVYVGWMKQQPIGGVAVWAHTGRGLHLSREQQLRILESWRQGDDDLPIVCGVGVSHFAPLPTSQLFQTDAAIRVVVEMAEDAARLGATAVMVHPPGDILATADWVERVVELHEAVSEVGVPIVAFYLYESAGGLPYTHALVERLLSIERVVAIKVATLDSVMTFQDLAATVRQVPGAMLITGEDRFLGYSLMMGADAALIGLAAACTDRCAALVEAWTSGETDRFLTLSRQLDAFAQRTFVHPMEGYVQRMLWALEDDGVFPRPVVDPFGPRMDAAERAGVTAAVRALRGS